MFRLFPAFVVFSYQVHANFASSLRHCLIDLAQTLKSKGFIKEQFSWQHYYWTLTNEGIDYLRTYLNIPSNINPKSLDKPAVTEKRPAGAQSHRQYEDRSDRDQYRRCLCSSIAEFVFIDLSE